MDADCMSEVCDKLTERAGCLHNHLCRPQRGTFRCLRRSRPPVRDRQAFTLVDSVKTAIKLALGNYAPTASLDARDGMTVTLFGSGSTLYVDGGPLINVVWGGRLLIRDLDVSLNVDVPQVIECFLAARRVSLDNAECSFTHNHATVAAVHAQAATLQSPLAL